MVSESRARSEPAQVRALAPGWHTAALVGLIVTVAITGTFLQATATPAASELRPPAVAGSRVWSQYLPLLLVNWGLLLYVSRVFLTHNVLPELVGRRWHGLRQVVVDLALAGALFAFIELFEALTATPRLAGRNAALSALLPSTGAERLTWVLVAVSVGFCEEVVYRGYLQRQLSALTGRASTGIALSAILFGLAHAEQGVASGLRIAGYAVALGVLARARRSLLPGIVCHVAVDLASALLR